MTHLRKQVQNVAAHGMAGRSDLTPLIEGRFLFANVPIKICALHGFCYYIPVNLFFFTKGFCFFNFVSMIGEI
jgi:hypothetical protein